MSGFNEIFAALHPSGANEGQRALFVDGQPLDELLDSLVPHEGLRGLVPAFEVWPSLAELSIVRARFLPQAGPRANAPLLVCPDDLDFSCAVVIAEVVVEDDIVRWLRVGRDISAWQPGFRCIGTEVRWFPGLGSFAFRRGSYAAIAARLGAGNSRVINKARFYRTKTVESVDWFYAWGHSYEPVDAPVWARLRVFSDGTADACWNDRETLYGFDSSDFARCFLNEDEYSSAAGFDDEDAAFLGIDVRCFSPPTWHDYGDQPFVYLGDY